jgi:ubiquinone/menaquinone biosynthesis C-methylase UbiE
MSWTKSVSEWDRFVAMLRPGPGDKILDVGSGDGAVAARVLRASKGAEVYAVDPSEKRVAAMTKEHPELKGSIARAEKLPFPESKFDKAYTTMALHHYSDLGVSLKEIARVIKRGGSFVILEVNPGSGLGKLFRFFGTFTGEHLDMMKREQLEALLVGSGLFSVQESVSLGPRYLILLART